ncbi:MAG: sigma-70 family RNA polymerase sigma factor [Armatimonadetes bacterium]|nr:sigma-70 family RNA polymerase sigma factor [Armatimonadota bacterium]
MEDKILVARFQRGEDSAFDLLVERHRRRVFNLAARLGPPGDADDLAQEIFIAVYRALPRFRGDSTFSTWLYRIALHVCSRHIRKRRWESAELDDQWPDEEGRCDPTRLALTSELQHQVHAAIDELPYKLRVTVVLRDLHGLSYEEIAQVVGCPVGTVRSRLY